MQVEKRTFRRISADHSVRILESDGTTFAAVAVDVSLTGMQILCDGPTLSRISPRGVQTNAGDGVRIHVRMPLSDFGDGRERLGLYGRVVGVRPHGDDEYRLGIQFTDFEPGTYNILESYIDSHL